MAAHINASVQMYLAAYAKMCFILLIPPPMCVTILDLAKYTELCSNGYPDSCAAEPIGTDRARFNRAGNHIFIEVDLARYILKRLALIVPTLLGIITVNFFIVQLAPGGPVDQMIAKISGESASVTSRIAGAAIDTSTLDTTTHYPGAEGIDPAMIKALEKTVRL